MVLLVADKCYGPIAAARRYRVCQRMVAVPVAAGLTGSGGVDAGQVKQVIGSYSIHERRIIAAEGGETMAHRDSVQSRLVEKIAQNHV